MAAEALTLNRLSSCRLAAGLDRAAPALKAFWYDRAAWAEARAGGAPGRGPRPLRPRPLTESGIGGTPGHAGLLYGQPEPLVGYRD